MVGDRMPDEVERHLLAAIELAQRSRAKGNHPFGALLVDANGAVVLEAENTVLTGRDCTGQGRRTRAQLLSTPVAFPPKRDTCTLPGEAYHNG